MKSADIDFVHRNFLFLDGGHEFELCSATVEIVTLPVGFEVCVAFQVVGQKADTRLEGNQFATEGKMGLFRKCKKFSSC
jgi:hypothetical protein